MDLVGKEERDDLCITYDLRGRPDDEAGVLDRGARGAALAQADLDVHARVAEVQRVRMALAPVAEDGDLSREEVDVAVLVDLGH
jgi:hypothetical protein